VRHFFGMHGEDLVGCGDLMRSQIHHACIQLP
jgi:hypothetical protein